MKIYIVNRIIQILPQEDFPLKITLNIVKDFIILQIHLTISEMSMRTREKKLILLFKVKTY